MSPAARAAVKIRRGYVAVGEGQVHYRRGGMVGQPVLVLLHQTPSHSAMYETLMQQMGDRYHLIALDTPGFGGSDPLPGDFTITGAAGALAAAVRNLGIARCHWFGHHTGAALALQVATDHPEQVDRLALSGPCLLDEAMKQRLPQLAAPLPIQADGSHLQQLWARIGAKDAEAPLALRQREVLAAAAAGEAYAGAYRDVARVDTEAQLRALRCPTLVFAGTEDPLLGAVEPAFRLLAQGRQAHIEGARTYVCERQAGAVAALLDSFFRP